MRSPFRLKGFSLLELMVALTIFSLIGMGAQLMLQSVLKAREIDRRHEESLKQLQKSIILITTDVTQVKPQSIKIGTPPFMVSFLRRGWENPKKLLRNDLVKVAYGLEKESLWRYSWPLEDIDSAPQSQLLLNGVSDFHFTMLPPRAVEIVFTSQDFGLVRRVMEVPEP